MTSPNDGEIILYGLRLGSCCFLCSVKVAARWKVKVCVLYCRPVAFRFLKANKQKANNLGGVFFLKWESIRSSTALLTSIAVKSTLLFAIRRFV